MNSSVPRPPMPTLPWVRPSAARCRPARLVAVRGDLDADDRLQLLDALAGELVDRLDGAAHPAADLVLFEDRFGLPHLRLGPLDGFALADLLIGKAVPRQLGPAQ